MNVDEDDDFCHKHTVHVLYISTFRLKMIKTYHKSQMVLMFHNGRILVIETINISTISMISVHWRRKRI